ncbi:phytanoyl-CoA dioxygenase family protein [Arenicella xantha]|uniref:Ectoine hydroxylase-related dioxygenase (Phytanoyl-CoA dioxygenase family) n=1 Tax=Arenicella xantha TaxID=644221 RepID=A0A395JHC7_9GAMM|nr:phytanoyl-CoA dioxygenase family protein [Arenicella xantha]RBP48949.1 ectoine hydroxylase-related dioxygenase (phytanoyl-CoA dioxygenase family) [Arenicella xantha]
MQFLEDGFEIVQNIISTEEIEAITCEVGKLESKGGGIRNAEKKIASVKILAESAKFISLASNYLSAEASFVRAIIFLKSIENNWLVTWHQDKTVSVSKRLNSPGWGPWSQKDGVLHVQPPVEVLEKMITFRVHLDESTELNGCLRLIPGSDKEGVMSQPSIDSYSKLHSVISCEAPAGSALIMRPHTLHSSSKAKSNHPRRVLHLEYSSYKLPGGLEWA